MALPTSRTEAREYCLRALGKPVIEINVDDDQVEDRIDEAISYYNDYHYDGVEKIYLKHQVTQQDIDNKYITIPESVIGITNIFDMGNMLGSGMFNAKYQFVLNNINEFVNYDITNFYMTFQYFDLMDQILNGKMPIRYNRHSNKLFIDGSWSGISVGSWIIADCYQVLDPNTYTDMWKDRWLLSYITAKIRYQFGINLTKFNGLNLPGNVQFNGEMIYNEAKEEIRKLEEDMISSYSLPVCDIVG